MNSIKKAILFIFLLLGLTLLLYWSNLDQRDNNNNQLLEDEKSVLIDRIETLYKLGVLEINLDDTRNINDTVYSSLADRLVDKFSIVLYIPEDVCSECVVQEYKELKKLPIDVQDRIVILTDFDTFRNAKLYIDSRKITYPSFMINRTMYSEIRDLKLPILFTLDESLTPNHIFIPISFMPSLSSKYYDFLKNKYSTLKEDSFPGRDLAEIEILESKCDFGVLVKNSTHSYTFKIRNISPIPLKISEVSASCGCTRIQSWSKDIIRENEEALIEIEFNADKDGAFSERISIFSNAKGSPHVLIVKGDVQ